MYNKIPMASVGTNKYLYNTQRERCIKIARKLSCLPQNNSDSHFLNRTIARFREGIDNLIDAEEYFEQQFKILPYRIKKSISDRHEIRFKSIIPIKTLNTAEQDYGVMFI